MGEFRAPHSREALTDYDWYCLDHIRAFNKSWNYYEGLSEDEVEADVRRDTTWRRPSWRFGTVAGDAHARNRFYYDPLHAFDGQSEEPADHQRAEPEETPDQIKALRVLGLTPPVTAGALKSRYKELVKCHHPDANNGSKDSEERFKEISEAYRILRDWIASHAATA